MAEIVTMPKLGFDMAEGTLVRWAVAEGAPIQKGALLAEIETDKATVEVESTHTGIVLKHLIPEHSIVPINEPIAVIGQPGEQVDIPAHPGKAGPAASAASPTFAAPPEAAAAPKESAPPESGQLPEGVRATPLARKMAAEHGVPLASLAGSGPKGRILKKDIAAYLAAPAAAAPAPAFALSAFAGPPGEDTPVELTRLRKAIGRRMVESRQQVPHFYVTYDYDMGPVMALRQEANTLLASEGGKLSVNDFVLKAVALCLREFPNLNASLGQDEIIRHGRIHVGTAVAVEGGLLTIVCQDTASKSLRQISSEVKEMAARAREGKVRPDDITGSTFTTSNVGMYGVDEFTAIINPPEVAILAIGGVRQTPVVENGEIKIGSRMKATLSVDHRVSDGAEAAAFMQALARYLQEPLRLML